MARLLVIPDRHAGTLEWFLTDRRVTRNARPGFVLIWDLAGGGRRTNFIAL
jgi:hypothetical protein